MNLPRQSIPEPVRRAGFTLIELLVVVATMAVLAAVLLPALAGTKQNTQAFQCLNNQRQIMLAWQMYAADNGDVLPPNDFYSGGGGPESFIGPNPSRRGNINWVGGGVDDRSDNHEATNTLMLTGWAALGSYNTNAATYHCPVDQSVVTGIGPRVRSVSMNSAVGTVYNNANPPSLPKGSPVSRLFLDGPWDDAHRSKWWLEYGTLGSMVRPVPSNLFVITEENPCSINDPTFAMIMGAPDANGNAGFTGFISIPGSYHNGGVTISFADGHSEIHKWLGAAVKITAYPGGGFVPANDPLSLQDLRWLQARTTARGQNQPPIGN